MRALATLNRKISFLEDKYGSFFLKVLFGAALLLLDLLGLLNCRFYL